MSPSPLYNAIPSKLFSYILAIRGVGLLQQHPTVGGSFIMEPIWLFAEVVHTSLTAHRGTERWSSPVLV